MPITGGHTLEFVPTFDIGRLRSLQQRYFEGARSANACFLVGIRVYNCLPSIVVTAYGLTMSTPDSDSLNATLHAVASLQNPSS